MAGTLRRSRRRQLSRLLTIALTLVIAAAVALVWVRVVQTLKEPASGPKTVGQPGALVWDGRVFTTPGQLKAYLSSKGQSYARWAARHPTAFGGTALSVVKKPTTKKHAAATKHPTTKKHVTTTKHTTTKRPTATTPAKTPAKVVTTPAKAATTPAKPVTHRVATPQVVGDTKSQSLPSLVLTFLLLIAGLVLGGSAALPPRYAPVALNRFYAGSDRRMVALAAATAILMGFGVSFYLS